ncbi:flagellar brake protein [Burkholderiaceae bacterium UC74_6]
MSTDAPQTAADTDFATLPEEELGEFRVASSAEIAAILRELHDSGALVTLIGEEAEPLVTRITGLDLSRGLLSLEMPLGMSHYSCKGLEVTAEAFLDQIRVQFELAPPVRAGEGRDAVLQTSLPALVYRFQRRKAFRVKPHSRTPVATLQPIEGGESLRLRVLDVSMGGMALLLPAQLLTSPEDEGNGVPELGAIFDVRVELDRHTHFKARLRLQHVSLGDESLGTPIGCAFSQLAPDAQRLLQLYIDQTQKLSRLARK